MKKTFAALAFGILAVALPAYAQTANPSSLVHLSGTTIVPNSNAWCFQGACGGSTSASSTLLSDNNNFSGSNSFQALTANSFDAVLFIPSPGNYNATNCGGVATTTYSGCVQALYASASTSPTHGVTLINTASATVTAPILFNINGLAVNFVCTAGVVIGYNGPSGQYAFTLNNGNLIGHPTQVEGVGCGNTGQPSGAKIAAGQTNTATTTGWLCGGSNGCVNVQFADTWSNGYGTQYEFGQNSYMYSLSHVGLSGGNGGQVAHGSLIQVDPASNSGERFVCDTCTLTDPGNSSATSSIFFATSSVASASISNCSLDDAQIFVSPSNGQVDIGPCHVEDSDFADFNNYWPIWAASSQVTQLHVHDIEYAYDATSAGTAQPGLVKHGVNLNLDTIHVDCYGGQSLPIVADHKLNNGTETETATQIQAGSGGASCITNIFANQAYSQVVGAGFCEDASNSFPFCMYIDSSNVVHFRDGNQDIFTFNSTGGVTLGTTANNGTIVANSKLAVGTSTTQGAVTIANFNSNATTSVEFGKAGQTKGTCTTVFDTGGAPVYSWYPAGATTPTIQNGGTTPAGCID